MFEEIGYKLSTRPKLIAAQDIFVASKDLHVVRLTYVANESIDNLVLSDEHRDYRWLSLNNTHSLNIEPYLKEVVEMVQFELQS